jgi:hypothetical protein
MKKSCKHEKNLLTFIPRIIIVRPSRLFEGRLPVTVPLGRERFPAALARNQPRGRLLPPFAPPWQTGRAEGAARNTAAERREARRPDRKGRKDASQASRRASQHVIGARNTQRFSALRSPSLARKSEGRGGRHSTTTARAGAAKQAASGAHDARRHADSLCRGTSPPQIRFHQP